MTYSIAGQLLARVALLLFLLLPLGLNAQVLGAGNILGAASAETVEQDDTADAINEVLDTAAARGVKVIVLDADGNVLSRQQTEVAQSDETMGSGALMSLQDEANAFRTALVDRLVDLPAAFEEVNFILKASSPTGSIMTFVWVLLGSMLLFSAGAIVEKEVFGKRIAKNSVVSRIRENPQGYSEKIPWLAFRFLMGVIGALVSMAVAYVLGLIVYGPIEDSAVQFTAVLINIGYFVCRFVMGIWRMILSPYLPQYRIPLFSNEDARRLHIWLCVVACFGFAAVLFGIWIGELGLNYEVYAFLSSLLGLAVMLANMLLVLVNRRAIDNALRNGKAYAQCSWLIRFLSALWVPGVFAYLIFAWAELTYDLVLGQQSNIPLISGAYGVLTVIIVVYGVINYLIERSFARARAIRARNADVLVGEIMPETVLPDVVNRDRVSSFEGLAQRIAGILAFVAGAYAFLSMWRPDTDMMAESVPDRTLDIIVVLFLGYIVYNAFRIWIDAKIAEEQGDVTEAELGDEGGGSSASRLATLLPLFRNFVLVVIIVILTLITLMELGVNVGPLFAGAGIVGVAVGFGSQSLVRDIFSGAFFLFDDAFRKGEYIDVGGVKGTVENISVRSFQLRHHLGALHTIPFGEIQVLTNYSRDWVIMKLPLRVTYDTDVEQVRKLIKKLGQELLHDPVIGENFIQPLKSQGVIEMQDSAMIIRVKFMTKPGDQWLVRKKVYEEIRILFEREGIKFAHREVTVRLADGKAEELSEKDREAITAAAQAEFEDDEMMEAMGDDR